MSEGIVAAFKCKTMPIDVHKWKSKNPAAVAKSKTGVGSVFTVKSKVSQKESGN
jgi:hypothetical protein